MATELEGKPLKFTAVFESKDAEMRMDEFLKKIQTINTKGVGSNASKAVNKASGQYKSILDGVTQSFEGFIQSNERFYTAIAKTELQLQKIRNEQNNLNKDLKQALITEDEYTDKTSRLTALRERLSQQLRDNKAQLKAFNDEQNRKPAFTRQDTLNELAQAHGAKSSPNETYVTPALSAMQKEVQELNNQLTQLETKVKDGVITNEQYAKSAESIKAKLQDINDHQEYWNQQSKNSGATDELEKQKTVLDAVSSEYREMVEDADSAFQSMSPKAKSLTNNLVSLREENRKLSAAQKELDTAFKSGEISQTEYLEASRNLGVQQNTVKSRIAETRKELSQIDAAERRSVGSIAEKSAKLTQLKQRYDQLSEAQRNNINVGGKIRTQYRELSAEVDKLNRSLSGTKSEGIGSVFSSIRGIAGAIGIAFGTQQLVSFGRELFDIARRAEGVELAFAKIGDPTALNRLREATRGTVSDLNLMTQAVRADKFRIPMDVLAKGLEFARRRANETGLSVDYLTQSFVDGLGRQSKLILDNLGISTRELSLEIEKTGDFMKAVSNIMDNDLSRGGQVIDMLADKSDRLATKWQNIKKGISDALRAWFQTGAGSPTPEGIESEVKRLNEIYSGFESYSVERQKQTITFVEKLLQSEKNIADDLAKRINNQSMTDYARLDEGYIRTLSQRHGLDKQLETISALEKSLDNMRKTNVEIEKQNRQKQGIFSITELEEQLSSAQSLLKDEIDPAKQKAYRTQVADLQKRISEINGNADKQASKQGDKLKREIEKDNNDRIRLLDQWAKADADYLNKQMSRDEQEIESVKTKYSEIRKAIEKHNKETKGKKISLDGFDDSLSTAISTTKERQDNDKRLKQYQEDYQNYLRYEELKKQVGEKYADEQAGAYKGVVSAIQGEMKALQGKKFTQGLTPIEEEQLKSVEKLVESHNRKITVDNQNRYIESLKMAQNFNEKRLEIEKKYQEARESLGDNITVEQDHELKKKETKEVSQLAATELSQSDAWSKLFSDLDALTAAQIDILIREIEDKFDDLSINFDPIDLAAIRKRLNEAKAILIEDNPFKQVGVALSQVFKNSSKDSKASAQEIKQDWSNLSKATESSFNFVANAVNSAEFLKDAIGEVGQTALMSMMSVATTAIAVSAAIKTAEKASVILAIIQAALIVVNAIASLFKSIFNKRDKELEKSIESKKEAVEELDRAFQQLERSMNRAAGSDYYKVGEEQIANLKEQRRLTEQMVKDEEDKKKTDKAKVQEYKDQIQSIDNQIADVGQTLIDTLLQSTFRDLADDLADSLVNAIKEGENAIDSLNKAYDDFIKDAIINNAKMLFLEPVVKQMMDEAAKFAKDNDYSLDGFDFGRYRSDFEEAGSDFIGNIESMFKGLGFEMADATSSLKSEGIDRMTEQTGTEVVGMYRAGFDIWKQHLATAQAQTGIQNNLLALASERLVALNAIQVNTANTVERLDLAITYLKHLKTIDSNLGGRYAG